MPTPQSGYENYCYGYPNQIQSSCVHGENSKLSEQNLSGRPQPYGFHNLNRQSICLADGTEHNYFTLPADYPLEQSTPPVSHSTAENVGLAAPPSVAFLAPDFCSKAKSTVSSESMLIHNLQAPTATRDASSVFKQMAVYDVYEEDVTARRSCLHSAVHTIEIGTEEVELKVDSGKPIISLERPTFGIFSLTDQKKPDIALTVNSVNKALDNAFSEDVTDVTSTHVPSVFDEVSIKCSVRNNKTYLPSLPDSELCGNHMKPQHGNNKQGNMLLAEERIKKWDPGILNQKDMRLVLLASWRKSTENCLAELKLMAITSSKVAALTWHKSITETPFILLSSTTYTWDPGVLSIIDMIPDKYTVAHEVQLVQHTTGLSFLSMTDCLQYIASSGINLVLHATSLTIQRATHLSQRNYICSVYYNSVLKTEYCPMRYLGKFSISCTERMQWDPGVKVSLYCWLYILTASSEIIRPLSCTHIPELVTWQNQAINASYLWDPGTILWFIHYNENLMWYFTVCSVLEGKEMLNEPSPISWSSIFQPMQYGSNFLNCNTLSIQQYTHQGINLYGISLWLINF